MPNMSPRWSPGILFGAVCMVLLLASAGCSDGSSNGANSTSIAPDNGFVTLGITDAPVDDAAEVVVVVTGVELQRGPESTITINFDTPKRIDLLRYRDGASFNLLDNQAVLPGNYQWLRLRITTEQNLQSGSYIKLRDGRQFPLYIPSGAETGLKLSKPFVVAQRATTRLMIDFDLRKSVVARRGRVLTGFSNPACAWSTCSKSGRSRGPWILPHSRSRNRQPSRTASRACTSMRAAA